MSEFGWPTAEEPEKPADDDKDTDGTTSAKRAKVASAGRFGVNQASKAEGGPDADKSDKRSAFDKLLGELAEKRVRAEEEPEKSKDDAGIKTEAAEDNGGYEPLPGYEQADNELNRGEAVLELNGDEPVAERVILLHPDEAAEPPKWRTQPELQHQSKDQTEPEPEEPGAGEQSEWEGPPAEPAEAEAEQPPAYGDIIPPGPPGPPGSHSSEAFPSDEPLEPAEAYRRYAMRQAAQANQLLQAQGVTKEELDDAIYRATKSGLGRGLATGLLVGGAYEHFKHKRREKKAAKNQREQTKKAERLQQDQNFTIQEQARQYAEATTRLGGTERRLSQAEQRLAAQRAEKPPLQPMEQQPPTVPPEHRVVQSAWHSIEVDAKTGKPVENPAFVYGQEYYRERAAEAAQHSTGTGGAAAPGAVDEAQVAMAGLQGGEEPGSSTPLPSVNVPSATTRGVPPSAPGQGVSGGKQPEPTMRLWPYVVTLVIVVILLIIVLS
ncbi:MAG TPA: hypothetical protein VLF40_06035 [Candidatus Saccharimonadales bacterium]|nr:hypothetical protein [Candidatus Saccharimonadales bacterium]